jgi:hypothetical protein
VTNRPSAHERGYSARWGKARREHLAHEPQCRVCKRHGKSIVATVVDHIIPANGSKALFWDRENWQSLCSRCHADKRALERSGRAQYSGGTIQRGCDINGSPTGEAHPWNKVRNVSGVGGLVGDPKGSTRAMANWNSRELGATGVLDAS